MFQENLKDKKKKQMKSKLIKDNKCCAVKKTDFRKRKKKISEDNVFCF